MDVLLEKIDSKDVLQRVEVYDSLSEYPCQKALQLLGNAVESEDNELARSYVTMLWAEMSKALGNDALQASNCIQKLKRRQDVQRSEYCMSSCYYAEYILGNESAMDEIKKIWKNSEGQVRIGIEYLLEDMKTAMK